MSSNPVHGEVYSLQHYVVKCLSVTCDRSVVVSGYSPVPSTNKTDRYDTIEKLFLKVALTTITLTPNICFFRKHSYKLDLCI